MSDLVDSQNLIRWLGPEWAGQVTALEDRFRADARTAAVQAPRAPDAGTALDVDVLVAGGGLSLLYAVELAGRGFSVAVVDPRGVGRGHREWNVSARELEALRPLLGDGLDALLLARYDRGIVRFQGGEEHTVRGVLDVAVDAQGLLDRLRALALSRGVRLVEGERVSGLASSAHGVTAQVGDGTMTARLVLDARGAASPFASWDLVCPTVGGVVRGLEFDKTVGEILVTVDGASGGLQPIWEGFPGRDGELTVYLFEYGEPAALGPRPLTSLFARFFETLPRYKRGHAELVRPAFGFIPGHSRLRKTQTSPQDRVLLVGDAAARHSPLTFCGFGSALRSYGPVSARIARLLGDDRLSRGLLETVWTDAPALALHGAMALMMIDRGGLGTARDPQMINRLLEAAFAALERQGEEVFRDFLQDRAERRTLLRVLRQVARAQPAVYGAALKNLRAPELLALVARLFAPGAWA